MNRLRNIDEVEENLSKNENIYKRENCMKKFLRQGVAVGIPTPKNGNMPIREAIITIDDETPQNFDTLSKRTTDI